MDPINERRIFNLIVQSAYAGAQYFLLTPKVRGQVCMEYFMMNHVPFQLLQNLEYSEAVAIHLVNNGQEMMPCDDWDLKKILG